MDMTIFSNGIQPGERGHPYSALKTLDTQAEALNCEKTNEPGRCVSLVAKKLSETHLAHNEPCLNFYAAAPTTS